MEGAGFSIVNFPTRIQNNHIFSTDNIFLNYTRLNYYTITPFINGLSDHDAQCVLIHDIDALLYLFWLGTSGKLTLTTLLNLPII
jgi:hypothetical protein